MAYDPLSRSTRVARASFLVVGTTSVVTDVFNIRLESIEGFEIPFPAQTMSIVLAVATCYLFAAFLAAFLDDVVHRQIPGSLKSDVASVHRRISELELFLDAIEFDDELQHRAAILMEQHRSAVGLIGMED